MAAGGKKRSKKFGLAFGISIGALLVGWVVLRVTGALEMYVVPTTACSPVHEVGERIFTTNLKTPAKGDFVAYHGKGAPPGESDLFLSQLIAQAGDTLEVKAGLAYVNGKLVDDSMQLKFAWRVPMTMNTYSDLRLKNKIEDAIMIASDTVLMHLTLKEAAQNGYTQKWLLEKGFADTAVWQGRAYHWNRDWFGPYVIPKDHVFLVSPNRANALDSRYRGPVPVTDLVGVVLE